MHGPTLHLYAPRNPFAIWPLKILTVQWLAMCVPKPLDIHSYFSLEPIGMDAVSAARVHEVGYRFERVEGGSCEDM